MTVRAPGVGTGESAPANREGNNAPERAQRATPPAGAPSLAFLAPVGSPAFVAWAHSDTLAGHVNNARQLAALIGPEWSEPSELAELRAGIERRLMAILELTKRRYAVTAAGMGALLERPSDDAADFCEVDAAELEQMDARGDWRARVAREGVKTSGLVHRSPELTGPAEQSESGTDAPHRLPLCVACGAPLQPLPSFRPNVFHCIALLCDAWCVPVERAEG